MPADKKIELYLLMTLQQIFALFLPGVVCGVYGSEIRTGKGKGTTGGKFQVQEIIFAEKPAQTKLEVMNDDR